MNKKLITKIVFTILITITFVLLIFSESYCADRFMFELGKIEGQPAQGNVSKDVGKVVDTLVVVAQVIGTGVAFIIILVLAMKYMSAAPGDKADIKKSALVYLIGAIIVFAVPQIIKVLISLSSAISSN